jgi:glycosyltransferase involved in cell wall biosynthesis
VKILYLAADPASAQKGAGVRIRATLAAFRSLGHDVDAFDPPPPAPGASFLDRAMTLRRAAADWMRGRRADLVQFRSIWEGVPAVEWAQRAGAAVVLEAHGFPSIELPYHYPGLLEHDGVLRKIIAEEQVVLAAAHRVVTPSRTGARFLTMRGVAADRVDVVPNAVDPDLFSPALVPPPDDRPLRLVYVGTLAPWQGLGTLLEALARFRGAAGVELHTVGPARSSWRAEVRGLARHLRVHHTLHVSGAVAQPDLVPILRTAHVCVAPLPADPRNALQGCCPIKLLEYMAAGRPVLATAIAPVEEIAEHEKTAWLVEAGSPAALAEGIAWMRDHAAEREALGVRAREAVLATWTPAHFVRRVAASLERAAAAGPSRVL